MVSGIVPIFLTERFASGYDRDTQPEFDIWMLDIAPGSEPALFLPNADSPATMRRAD
jgi:hypothetical protein